MRRRNERIVMRVTSFGCSVLGAILMAANLNAVSVAIGIVLTIWAGVLFLFFLAAFHFGD